MKKLLFTDKAGVSKKLERYLGIKEEKVSKENRIDKCMEAIINVQDYEHKHTYEDSVWEIGYLKYKAFIRRCEREDSYKSLKFAYDLGKPTGKMLFEQTAEPKIRFYEVPKTNLKDFIRRESEWFAESISGKCTKRWVQNHIDDIVKLCSVMAELDLKKGIGLIEKVRRGLGKPDLIYVKNFINECWNV